MKENEIKRFMLERGMRGYDSAFVFGFVSFLLIYLFIHSFEVAITTAIFFWILSLVIFICFYFELADDYYRKVKMVAQPRGNRISNIFIGISIWFAGWCGGFVGWFIMFSLIGEYHFVMIIGVIAGDLTVMKLYFNLILKRL